MPCWLTDTSGCASGCAQPSLKQQVSSGPRSFLRPTVALAKPSGQRFPSQGQQHLGHGHPHICQVSSFEDVWQPLLVHWGQLKDRAWLAQQHGLRSSRRGRPALPPSLWCVLVPVHKPCWPSCPSPDSHPDGLLLPQASVPLLSLPPPNCLGYEVRMGQFCCHGVGAQWEPLELQLLCERTALVCWGNLAP